MHMLMEREVCILHKSSIMGCFSRNEKGYFTEAIIYFAIQEE